MATSYNPYEAPGTGGYGPPQHMAGGGMITPMMAEHLRATRPWVRLLSILLFLAAGMMVLTAGLMFLGGLAGLATAGKRSMGAEALVGPVGGMIYFAVAGFYAIPAIMMHRFANAIDSFVTAPSSASLEDTLDKSRGYWKFCGILALAMIALTVVMMVGAIVVGVAAGLAAKP